MNTGILQVQLQVLDKYENELTYKNVQDVLLGDISRFQAITTPFVKIMSMQIH